jgi:GNAT superfamily N-acetyltransferase
MSYQIRPAALDDRAALTRHRIQMFHDMGVKMAAHDVADRFDRWLAATLPAGTYRAWVVEEGGDIVAGGGITILPWPPGPSYLGERLAFVYNVYTEPNHRRRGLARLIMETIHAWCRENGVLSLALNASDKGLPLYESMGYRVTDSPMMFLSWFSDPGVSASPLPGEESR